MKQFVKALLKEGECFNNLCLNLFGISDANLKEGVFVEPEMRKPV